MPADSRVRVQKKITLSEMGKLMANLVLKKTQILSFMCSQNMHENGQRTILQVGVVGGGKGKGRQGRSGRQGRQTSQSSLPQSSLHSLCMLTAAFLDTDCTLGISKPFK